jgi:hypothetical protein
MLKYLKKQQNQLKIRHFSLIASFVFFLSLLYPFSQIFAALSCSVTTQAACTGGSVTLLRMSGSTNAHAELPSQSNTNYDNNVICCSSSSSIGNSCSAFNKQVFLKLSGVTNGTVQETSVNTYGTDACLSDAVGNDTITVGYQNSNCTGYDTTLASISSSDNAHIGDGSAYTRKVCATVIPQTISFDIDTASDFSNGESSAPYSVDLGTITTSTVKHSDTSTVRMIVIEGDTNASGGMVVTVRNANGTNGLVSTSTPADNINSATATMANGTENYGLCVATSGLTGFSRSTGYSSDSCSLASGTNGVQALSTTPTSILNTGGAPVSGGHAEIVVNGSISTTTASHNDYADTLTFIATGTF